MKVQKLFIFVFISILTIQASNILYSQTFVEHVLHFPLDKYESKDIKLASLDKNGLLMIQNNWSVKHDSSKLILNHISHNFRPDWDIELIMPKQFRVIDHQFDEQYTYLLGIDYKRNYSIIRVRHEDGAHAVIPYKNIEEMDVFIFRAFQNHCIIGGDSNGRPLIISLNLSTQEKNILPSIHQINATIERVDVHKESHSLCVIMQAPKTHRHRGLYINTYDIGGSLLEQYYATPNSNFDLLTFRPIINTEGDLMIFGTYTIKESSFPQGVYSMRLLQEEKEQMKFYDFSYLKNFYKHLDEQEQESIYTKVTAKKAKNKFYYQEEQVILHDLKLVNNEIILTGETAKIIYSKSTTETNAVSFKTNSPTTKYLVEKNILETATNTQIPSTVSEDRYQVETELPARVNYHHTFVCSFDQHGKLLWDNNFEINHSRQRLPIPMTQNYIDHKKIVFLMVNRDNIQYAISDHKNFDQMIDLFPVRDNRPEETHQEYYHGGIQAWYNNHFVFSGLRDVKNTINGEERRFFYISCFSYTNNSLTD